LEEKDFKKEREDNEQRRKSRPKNRTFCVDAPILPEIEYSGHYNSLKNKQMKHLNEKIPRQIFNTKSFTILINI
jgi:hypothetical protein